VTTIKSPGKLPGDFAGTGIPQVGIRPFTERPSGSVEVKIAERKWHASALRKKRGQRSVL